MAASHITDFIQSLSSEEIKVVREHTYRSNNRSSLKENKINKLLDILIKQPERKSNDRELAKLLESNHSALRTLKSRLFEHVKEALLSDDYFENLTVFNEREKIVFTLKKKVLFAKSIYRTLNHGRIETLNLLLKEIIAIGKKNQVFDVLIEALIIQKQVNGLRIGISEFERTTNQIKFYDDCFKAVHNALDDYYRLILNQEFIKSLTKEELKKLILNSITRMQADYKLTNSQEVNYYMHILTIALYEYEKDFKSALECCEKLLKIIKQSTIMYSRDRIGFVMGNLSVFNIYLGKYQKASSFSKKSQLFLQSNSFNQLVIKEQEFFADFYGNKIEKALECCVDMLDRPVKDVGGFRMSKLIYYKSCCFFKLKQFKEALKLINVPLEIEKDKAGRNINLRMLLIMTFIELNKSYEAITSISTLRKHVERTNKTKQVSDRDSLIVKLLIELEKDGFKRNEKNKTAIKLLKTLADKDKSTSWNYFTPELIPFHEWVMTRPVKG